MKKFNDIDLDIMLKIIEKNIKYKFEHLNEDIENINSILPNIVEVDIKTRKIIATHFEPSTEEERNEIINYIAELINQIRLDYNSICILIYSQMESALYLKIKNIKKEDKFKKYEKSRPEISKFKNMIDFLVNEQMLCLKKHEQYLIDSINKILRRQRNSAVHHIYEVITTEIVTKEIIGTGENIGQKLINGYNMCIEEINGLFVLTEGFFNILKTI